MKILLVAGQIGVGKTTVSAALSSRWAGTHVRVRAVLSDLAKVSEGRGSLQAAGAQIDRRTRGRWLSEALIEMADEGRALPLIVDSVRTVRQTVSVFDWDPNAGLIFLDARAETRRSRYVSAAVQDALKRSVAFDAAMRHRTEVEVLALKTLSSCVFETDRLTIRETLEEIERSVLRPDR